MTVMTPSEAYEAILEHHERLGEELAARADAVSGAVANGQPYGAAVAGLVAYLAEEVLPHAAAEEKTIYPAATRAGLAGTVEEMLVEHVTLSALGARVASLTDGKAAAEQAQQVARLFTAHAAKENNLLLPALLADTSVDLAGLLARMHGGAGHDELPAPASASRRTTRRPRWCPCCCRQRRRWPAAGRRTVPARSPRRHGPRCAMTSRTWRLR